MAASDAHSGHQRPGAPRAPGALRAGYRRSVADYAWEFLRRNPDYRADFLRSAAADGPALGAIDPRWGLRFPADPSAPAETAEVFWRPEVAPGVVIPLDADGPGPGRPIPQLAAVGTSRRGEDGLHLRMGSGLQLLLRGEARPEGPLVVVLAFDHDFGLRVRAVQALHRAVAGGHAPASRLTNAQRARLDHSLQALDGSLNREPYRAIAETLFGAAAVEREPWKTSSVRGVTIRLVSTGKALMRGGYLKLLRAGL